MGSTNAADVGVVNHARPAPCFFRKIDDAFGSPASGWNLDFLLGHGLSWDDRPYGECICFKIYVPKLIISRFARFGKKYPRGSGSIRKPSLSSGVILRAFSPEEPTLSEVEGISRAATATQR